MGSGLFRKKRIESYFLEQENPYSKRRAFKMKALYQAGGVSFILFMGFVLFLGDPTQRKPSQKNQLDYSVHTQSKLPESVGSIHAQPEEPFQSESKGSIRRMNSTGIRSHTSSRTYSAKQVIRPGESGNDPASRLPMGSGIPVRLINAVLSTLSSSPVIAEVREDVLPPSGSGSTISIPKKTKAIGSASYDDLSQRIQIRFHTLVYPEGEQHPIQGIGLMSDGSAGLAGEYHSGETKRQVGKFIGNFVGGFAEGMKEKTSGGPGSTPYSPGSLKNGVLNGVSLSATDASRSYSDSLSQTKPWMTLPAGQEFMLFLEHDYNP